MVVMKWIGGILLLFLLDNTLGAFVGVNIGTDVSNMPNASDVVKILKANQITHVRLYEADAPLLKALANSGVEVMLGITNKEVVGMGKSSSVAAAWVNKNVVSYLPSTNITSIAVGNEILTAIPNAPSVLIPAIKYLYIALVASNLNFQVKISTPLSMDVISRPFPPSTATFNSSWNSTIFHLLQFLKKTNSYYMLNAYPYDGYMTGNGIFPIEYALFRSLPSVQQIVDPNSLFRYNSMFDAMVDATYYSMEAFNISGIPVVVTGTGWPWLGGAKDSDATAENAETFNNNLIRRVLNGSGPPNQPTIPINTYIYELFNEDNVSGPASEKKWGLFFANGTAVYPISLGNSSQVTGNSTSLFCIAKTNANPSQLQAGINWACGQGGANCTAIQKGQPCYTPNTYESHASYAYNEYYQNMHLAGGTCDFDGTAMTTTVDPSHGSCIFTGSLNNRRSNGVLPSVAFEPMSPFGGSTDLQVSMTRSSILMAAAFLGLVLL